MNNAKRLYNENRKLIWMIILVIVAVIILIQTLNNYYKNKESDDSTEDNNQINSANTNYSVISQTDIEESISAKSSNVIYMFFESCNNSQIEEAYDFLSTDCKEELYSTVNDFKSEYCDVVFSQQKEYESALWITTTKSNTYRMEIYNDILSTGQVDNMPIEEYYTIVLEDDEYKLNIGNFIGKEDINISNTQDGLTVTVLSKTTYMDYEYYNIQIENKTGSKISFNTKDDTSSVYLQDENDLKYIAFLNEIADSQLELSDGQTKTIEFKFNRTYKPTKTIEKIVFGDISLVSEEKLRQIEVNLAI